MLDVNNVLPTPYQKVIERWRLLMFRRRRRRRKTKTKTKNENEDERRKRRRKTKTKTKDENGVDRKRTERKKKVNFQNKCALVPKTNSMRKEEGATVGVCRPFCSLPSLSRQSRLLCGPDGQRSTTNSHIQWERVIKYHKCPTFDANRNAGDFQSSDWPSNYRWNKWN